MLKIRYFATGALMIAAVASAACAAEFVESASQKEQKLIAVLQSNAPPQDKAIPCKLLAVYGSKDAVPALAPLLADKELASWARTALEAIPDPAADEALREALGKLEGRLLIGTINSIAVRRDPKAVEGLVKCLKDKDNEVASAAAVALGRIGGDKAATVLQETVKEGPAALKSAAAQGCVLCAEKCLAAGDQAEAVKLYDLVREAKVSKPRVLEATRGAILARKSAGLPLLVEQLRSQDKALFNVGLSTARELGGAEVAKALADELAKIQPAAQPTSTKTLVIVKAAYGTGEKRVDVTDKLAAAIINNSLSIQASNNLAGDPANGVVKDLRITYTLGGEKKSVVVPENKSLVIGEAVPDGNPRQAALIYALGDVGQTAALAELLKAAKSGSWSARTAAVRVLGQIGDASAVPVLLEAAQSSGDLGQSALESLGQLKGKAVDAAVVKGLAEAKGQARAVLIQVVGDRGIQSAVPTLFEDAGSDNAQVRLAAIGALGMTVGFDQLGRLIEQFVSATDAQEIEAAKSAVQAACSRMPDRNATAEKIVGALPGATAKGKATLLGVLGQVGGSKALEGVAAAARSTDDKMQDAATQVLGAWMTSDAAPVLLDLARTGPEKYKVRTLRGYLRIARQHPLPGPERVAMCREVEKLCQRSEEKKLVVEILRRVPSADALAMVAPYAKEAGVRAEATAAAVTISEKILPKNPAAVAAALKQVVAAGGTGDMANRAKTLLEQASQKAGK